VHGADHTELRQLSIVSIAAPNEPANPLIVLGDGVSTRVSHVTLSASGSGTNNTGLVIGPGATAFLQNVTVNTIGMGNAIFGQDGSATIDSSRLVVGTGGLAMNINSSGTVLVSNSLIGGAVFISGSAVVKCFGTYRNDYTATLSGCQ
jgi:hypothetical protein